MSFSRASKHLVYLTFIASLLGLVASSNPASALVATPAPPTLAAGGSHSCATVSGGLVACWGRNVNGELGDSTTQSRNAPVTAKNLVGAVSVAAGAGHSCATTISGAVYCWGNNTSGQIGDGTNTQRKVPTPVTGISNAVRVTAGSGHTCALLSTGKVRCWGANNQGQLGDGTTNQRSTSIEVLGISNAVSISAGNSFACAVISDNSVHCWGGNGQGQLGDGTTAQSSTATTVTGITDAVGITSGDLHNCVIRSNGLVSCWGENANKQIGVDTPPNVKTPIEVSGITGAINVAGGAKHSCAALSSGAMKCWGDNFNGKLGDGTTNNSITPVAVLSMTTAVLPVAADSHTCARLANNTLRCWGAGGFGEIGDGLNLDRSVPVSVLGFTTIAGGFTGITPFRVLDSRAVGGGACISSVRSLQVAGVEGSGVPSNAAAVALNFTVVGPRAAGFLTVYPSDAALPLASNLNYSSGQVVANNVNVKTGPDGAVNIYASAGCPDVVVDLVGSFSSGDPSAGGFTGITPVRIGDTRTDGGATCVAGSRSFQVTGGVTGIPSDAVAAALNVTVVTPGAAGYLTVYPEGIARPVVSTLNFTAGQIVPNGTLLKIGNAGQIRVFANAGCPHVVVDVVGWFAPGIATLGGFVGITPARLVDSRSSFGASCLNKSLSQQVAGSSAAPDVPLNAGAVALNVTAIGGSVPGYITAYPAGVDPPTASTVNFNARQVVPNGALVKVGAFASDAFITNGGCPDLVVDVVGYFVGAG